MTSLSGQPLEGPVFETYHYDGLHRMVRAQSGGDVETKITHDSLSRVVQEKTFGRTAIFTHDDVGNVTGVGYPSGLVTSRQIDSLNRPGQISAGGQSMANYNYRGPALVTGGGRSNGLTTLNTYDEARRLRIQATFGTTSHVVLEETIAWTPRSLKSAVTRKDRHNRSWAMMHDGAMRLQQLGDGTCWRNEDGDCASATAIVANNSVASVEMLDGAANRYDLGYDTTQNL